MTTQTLALDLEMRTVVGKAVKRLRADGLLPATVYGRGVGPFSVQMNARSFLNTFKSAGRTSLIELHMPGQPMQAAFVQDIQRHPVTREILHVDLRVVDLKRTVDIEVPVVTVGESPLVKQGVALVNHGLERVMVHALPAELPQNIEVDISILDSLDKSIFVRDLPPNPHYSYVTDGDEMIVSLTPIRAAMEPEAEEAEEAAPSEPELVRRERKDEEGEEEE